MAQSRPGDINDVVLDLMTYQAFIAGLSHLPDMIAAGGTTMQECLLRILTEACDSEFAFAAVSHPEDDTLRPFAWYPNTPPVALPQRIASPTLAALVRQGRHDVLVDGDAQAKMGVEGVRTALVVPYSNRGATCVLCVCNRDPDAYARPGLGMPYISHEVKMCQALLQLRPL